MMIWVTNMKGFGGTLLWSNWSIILASVNLSHDSWCPSQDSNQAPHEHKSTALTLDQPVQWKSYKTHKYVLMAKWRVFNVKAGNIDLSHCFTVLMILLK
jgi:hypothetical protein